MHFCSPHTIVFQLLRVPMNGPTLLVWMIFKHPRFAAAYGGTSTPYARPGMVTCVRSDMKGTLVGFWAAPFTSTLNPSAVSCSTFLICALQ